MNDSCAFLLKLEIKKNKHAKITPYHFYDKILKANKIVLLCSKS